MNVYGVKFDTHFTMIGKTVKNRMKRKFMTKCKEMFPIQMRPEEFLKREKARHPCLGLVEEAKNCSFKEQHSSREARFYNLIRMTRSFLLIWENSPMNSKKSFSLTH